MEREGEFEIVTQIAEEPSWVAKDWESSAESAESEIQSMIDSSDDVASCFSVDSIAQNADFVGFISCELRLFAPKCFFATNF